MGPITGLAATDRLGAARVDGEFKAKYSFADACFVKHIPIFLKHHLYFTARSHSDVGADTDMLLELWLIPGAVPEVDVGSSGGNSGRETMDGVAILGEHKEVVVNVVAVVEWHIAIGRLWAADFGWDINHERLQQSGGIERSGAGDVAID